MPERRRARSERPSRQREAKLQPTTIAAPPDAPIIEIEREFDAPAWFLFDAFTRPEFLVEWWGPGATRIDGCQIDLQVGGRFDFEARSPDGDAYRFTGQYREIVPPERIVFSETYDGISGEASLNTVSFDEHPSSGTTTVTSTIIHRSFHNRDEHLASGIEADIRQSLGRLDELLDERSFTLERLVNADADAVFRAWTNRRSMSRWCAPTGYQNRFVGDVREGGTWCQEMTGPDGRKHRMEGIYLHVDRPRRLVFTHEPYDKHSSQMGGSTIVLTFEADGDQTHLRMRQGLVESADARDQHRAAWSMGLDHLEAFLRGEM